MTLRLRPLPAALFSVLASMILTSAVLAQDKTSAPERTQFGSDITVGPNEQISDATCFGCSVHVRGHVNGDVTVFFGSIIVEEEGEVNGDLTNFGRGVRLDRSSKVGGDVTVFGGPIRRDADASVGGDVTSFKGSLWLFLIFGLPFLIFAAIVLFIIWLVRRLTRPAVPVAA
jgi:hypothetical protein